MRFKTLVMGLILAGFTAVGAWAQTFNLGLEAGANFSDFVGSNGVTDVTNANAYKLGFVGGGFLCLNFGNSFGIRPEILYEQKGNAISGTSTVNEVDYIEVPVLLKFGLGTPVFNPSILLGPAFSWNTVATFAKEGTGSVNGSDIGLVGGVEVDIDKFLISGRYELGLDNVTQQTNFQNGTITVLVGYSFI